MIPDAPHYLTRADALRLLRRHLKSAGYYGAKIELARAAGVSHCSVSHVLTGRHAFGDKLLAALGLRRVELYEVIDDPVPIPKRARSMKPSSLLHIPTPPAVQGSRMKVHRAR